MAGRLAELHLHAIAPAPVKEEEIELRAPVSGPEVGLWGADAPPEAPVPVQAPSDDAPTRGWAVRLGIVGEVEQAVKDACVAQIHLGGLHLALREVLVPRLEAAAP